MTVVCAELDPSAGVALRLSAFLDCQARALGENGFQAFAGGAIGTSILSGLITIFVALIGYRLILGESPGLRDGVSWTVRLGFVLALVTSWPAFQTLFYQVAIEGPREVADVILPASGLPSEGLEWRVQQAYDTIRLGSGTLTQQLPNSANVPAEVVEVVQRRQFQEALPRTSVLFVLTTTGFTAALRIAAGFLLAIGPIAIMSLLFDATLGLFNGWIRALAGMAVATVASMVVTALNLLMVESELARLQALQRSPLAQAPDAQSLSVIVLLFALIMLVTVFAAVRMMNAFRLPWRRSHEISRTAQSSRSPSTVPVAAPFSTREPLAAYGGVTLQTRGNAVSDSLAATVRREQTRLAYGGAASMLIHNQSGEAAAMSETTGGRAVPQNHSRRPLGRHTRGAARRDRSR